MSNDSLAIIVLAIGGLFVLIMLAFLFFHIPFMKQSREKAKEDMLTIEHKVDHTATIVEEKLSGMQAMLDQNRTLLMTMDLKTSNIESKLSEVFVNYQSIAMRISSIERESDELRKAFNNLMFNYHQMMNNKKTDQL